MKNVIIVLTLLLSISCNKEKKIISNDSEKEEGFVINGTVTGFEENTMLYLKSGKIIDSVPIVDGKFQFIGSVDRPKIMSVQTKFDAKTYKETYKTKGFLGS